jgi:ATP-dependent RNA helicase SUPV3L1/SUV3
MRIRELASVSKNFRLGISSDKLEIADAIQHIPLTIYDRLTLCHLPVWQRAENSMEVLRALATIISENGRGDLLSIKEIPLESLDIDLRNFKGTPIDYLHKLESLHVAINQYVWLSYRFSGMFRDQALAFHVRSLVEQKLVDTLERLDFTQSDLQSIRQNKRLMAQSQKLSRKVLGEGDLKDVEQELDDPPLDQDEHWEPHQTSEEVAATASAP